MLLQADAALIPLKDNSVHCVVTSPPYWGLRKYTGEQGRGEYPNLGLEPTPELHIQHIVEIFREVKRVLRDDGVVWLNYGDCYSSANARRVTEEEVQKAIERGERLNYPNQPATWTGRGDRAVMDVDVPPGNLMLMPHRVAIALQDDGWIVRNDLIWFKRNPMPESCAGWRFEGKACDCMYERREELVALNEAKGIPRHRTATIKAGDVPPNPNCSRCNGTGKVGEPVLKKGSWRHTRAHEYIFMLTKKMQYWCNQEAVREAEKNPGASAKVIKYQLEVQRKMEQYSDDPNVASMRDWKGEGNTYQGGRNPRSVLDVPTAPYKGAHYATFPPNLIAPLIRASCPRRACPECGQGWAAVVERSKELTKGPSARYDEWNYGKLDDYTAGEQQKAGKAANLRYTGFVPGHFKEQIVTNYRPTCECGHDEYVPGIVLDPFIGSGTTGAVARELQRRWVGLDISMEYLDQQAKIRALNLTPSNALDELPLFNL